MSDLQLELQVKRLVIHSGFKKSEAMMCPLLKIIQMRYKNISKLQARRVVKNILQG